MTRRHALPRADVVPSCPGVLLYAFVFGLRAAREWPADADERLSLIASWLTGRYGWGLGACS